MRNALSALPSVDQVLRHPDVAALAGSVERALVVELARGALDALRRAVRAGELSGETNGMGLAGRAAARVLAAAAELRRPSLRRVINATGGVLHTNLGRAPLSEAARAAVVDVTAGYSNLELDLKSGARGSRHTHLEAQVCAVTGAEAALAVNNNAAALVLLLAELARGREVVVSRGQAVEIGGGFRIPDVMRESGARLVEVGTTNRTHIADYAAAIGPETAALLHVHPSNFRLIGFSQSVEIDALAALGRERGIPVIADQGSGCLLETEAFGIPPALHEPTVQEQVRAGADLVCFSGDKLLGGPQAGIICGRAEPIARLKRHPLARALRLDKGTIAALAATLLHSRVGEAVREVPVWRMIGAPESELRRRAQTLARRLRAAGVDAHARRDESAIGGGSLPGVTLPTWVASFAPPAGVSVDELARALRLGEPALIGRIADEMLVLDARTLLLDDLSQIGGLIAQVSEGIIGSVRN